MKPLICCILLFLSGCSSQQFLIQEKPKTAHLNYIEGMKSEVPGLVEDILFRLVFNHTYLPEFDCKPYKEILLALSVNGVTPAIRRKAAIAFDYLFNSDELRKISLKADYDDPEKIFHILSGNEESQEISQKFENR